MISCTSRCSLNFCRILATSSRTSNNLNLIQSSKFSSDSENKSGLNDPNNPITRTLRILKNDIKSLKYYFKFPLLGSNNKNNTSNKVINKNSFEDDDFDDYMSKYAKPTQFQTHCDVLVIGGGGVGSSIAYWLKKKAREGLNVVVVEKDPTYKEASTVLSVGGLRQQFSLPENIQMSLYGADFVRSAKRKLGEEIDLNFVPYGYLVLASEKSAEILKKNSELQNELGARNELLTASRLKQKFPWLNVDGIELGCHGLEKEGWFDPWALLMGLKKRAIEYGAHFTDAEVIDFEYRNQPDMIVEGTAPGEYDALDKVKVRLPNGEERTIKFALCIIAAGASSGKIARLAKIGEGKGLLRIPLPVEPRKRYVYVFQCQGQNEPGLNTPLTIDPTNTYFRRDGLGGNFICGRSPSPEKEPCVDNLDVDYDYFDTDIWPVLAKRVPAFECIKVSNAWSGFYEYNTFDENGIVGSHPYYHNLYIATGFSGHGIQQAPAVGRAISELIMDGRFRTIDLTRLSFDRIIVDQPMFEVNII